MAGTDTSTASPQGQDDQQPDSSNALEDYQFQDDEGNEDGTESNAPAQDDEGAVETAAPVEAAAPELTTAEIMAQADERAFQRFASWSGRRDKELLDAVGNMINQRPPSAPATNQAQSDPATILDNPDAWVEERIRQTAPRVLSEEINRLSAVERNYKSSLIQHAGQIMDTDPLFADKVFGNEVIGEIQQLFGSVNKSLPPDVNAQLLISNAVTNIYRKNAAKKVNALAGNTGVKPGVGGVKPGNPPPVRGKVIKLSPATERLAKRWGYKEEDLQRVFKDA